MQFGALFASNHLRRDFVLFNCNNIMFKFIIIISLVYYLVLFTI